MYTQHQIICNRSAAFDEGSFFIEKSPENTENSKRKD
jgi:hypothetical protein